MVAEASTGPERTAVADPGSKLIEVSDVGRAFGGVKALDGCCLDVPAGAIVGLIGPNGSGKTTLFNVITGYERADKGNVRYKGVDITGTRPDRVFGMGIGRTFQITRIFARLTVLENMLIATQRRELWLRSVLRGAGSVDEHRRALELLAMVGIAHMKDEPAGHLSFGQRKLLELAYILIADPEVLLLDEPAGGVNPRLLEDLGTLIQELNRDGKTVVLVEHNMGFVMSLCDSVSVMQSGRVLVTGRPDEIRHNEMVLHAYLGVDDEDGDARIEDL